MKICVFRLKFHWSLFLRVQLTISQHWFNNGFVQNRRQAIIGTNADPTHWRIYAPLEGDQLMPYLDAGLVKNSLSVKADPGVYLITSADSDSLPNITWNPHDFVLITPLSVKGSKTFGQVICTFLISIFEFVFIILGPLSPTIFSHNSNLMEISFLCIIFPDHQIAINFSHATTA